MKKKLSALLLILLLLALLCPAALAAGAYSGKANAAAEGTQPPILPFVLDNAGLLSEGDCTALTQKAEALSAKHQCNLYIVTVQDYTALDNDIRMAVKGIQRFYHLGEDTDGNLVILLLSMQDRDYWAEGFGSKGEAIYSEASSWLIEDKFLDNFKNNDWYGGFSDFLDACDTQLTKLENGEDVNQGANIITGPDGLDYHSYNYPSGSRGISTPVKLAIIVLAPMLIALIVCSVFKSQMKTARLATRADEYLVPHSMDLHVRQDRFTHRTETRTKIESNSGGGSRGGGGGGSFHASGGGSSGRGGKF